MVGFALNKNIHPIFCLLLLFACGDAFAASGSEVDPFASDVPLEKVGAPQPKPQRQDAPKPAVKTPSRPPAPQSPRTAEEKAKVEKAASGSKKTEEFDPFASDQPPEKSAPAKNKELPDGSGAEQAGAKSGEKSVEKNTRKHRQDKAPVERSHLEPGMALKFDGGVENVFSVASVAPLLPFAKLSGDQILPPYLLVTERVEPVFKMSAGRGFLLHARPRFSLENQRYKNAAGQQGFENSIRADAGETFATWSPSARFSLTVGKQNFQWGVAEMASPSNWIFRSTKNADTLLRTPQTEVDTRDSLRFNLSWGQAFNVVLMAEYEPEDQTLRRDFSGRRVFLKPELAWNAGADFLGIVIGGAEKKSEPFFGEYFLFNMTDSFSLFADFSHQRGSGALRPVVPSAPVSEPLPPLSSALASFEQSRFSSKKFTHEGVLGIKYNFTNGAEVRLEGYYNSAGLSLEEIEIVEKMESASSPSTVLFFDLGQEYRSQGAILFAARPVGFDTKRKWNLFGRYLKPIIDPVGVYMVYSEYAVSDSAVLFLGVAGTHGRKISEVALPFRTAVTLGQKYVW
ncbi:MAG: hypothetical protein RIR26_2352 [Pseudomonadota bacterium]